MSMIFGGLVALVAGGFLALVKRSGACWRKTALLLAVWLVLVGGLAASGVLGNFSRFPPPFMLTVNAGLVLTLVLAFSPWGTRLLSLPLAVLVGSQMFRLPLELIMSRAYHVGLMPQQMSFEGRNFDILTGMGALVLFFWPNRQVIWAWSIIGLGLLINVVTVAVLTLPTPMRVFFNDNLWVTLVPYCWLPTLFVPLALLGHLLVFRKLLQK